jgi:arylsulfatase A-like enzyme
MPLIRTFAPCLLFFITLLFASCSADQKGKIEKPNFLLLMSDNQSWNHLGCYGDQVVVSPTIDKLASEGVRFTHAFCGAPSCTPARAAMLTGQDIWRLEEGANLWGILPSKFRVFTDILAEGGYQVGMEGKGWGPGNYVDGGWNQNPGGKKYDTFEDFCDEIDQDRPFFYWFSSRDPHRPYAADENFKDSARLDDVTVPPYLPDNEEVRKDILDYYAEIRRFDSDVSSYVNLLGEHGLKQNTMIVVCSDNGWQMPRGLANLYDFGTRIPLIFVMPEKITGNRVVDDFVSLNDLAPTFLELAGLPVPKEMTAISVATILSSDKSGIIEKQRDFITSARERHAYVRSGGDGYGGRCIRTRDFLYIRNYDFERWPAGDPPLFGDVDAHMLHYPCPTKIFMLQNRDEKVFSEYFQLAFDKRPYEELYDLKVDPYQLHNVATLDTYASAKQMLSEKLDNYLIETNDPRLTGGEMKWIGAKYYAAKDFRPEPSNTAREALGLKESYSYID